MAPDGYANKTAPGDGQADEFAAVPHPTYLLRRRLIDGDYRLVECNGKAPTTTGWQLGTPTAEAVVLWRPDSNTGLIMGPQPDGSHLIAVDIDVYDPALAFAIDAKAVELLGDNPLLRIGQAPKRLRMYRCLIPKRRKIFFPGGGAVEILTRGQQFIAYGVHPDTGQPYRWVTGSSPENVALSEVPETTPEEGAGLPRLAV